MAENQFSVKVPSLNEAIAGGEEAYSGVQKLMQTRQLTQAREAAAKNVMDGGDLKNSLAMLMGIGDEKGAATLATVMHNQQTAQYQDKSLGLQGQQIAESGRHNKALEGQSGAQLAETSRMNTAQIGNMEQQRTFQGQQIGETMRHNQALEGQSGATLAETQRQHNLEAMKPFKIGANMAGDIYAVKDPSSPQGIRIVDTNTLPGRPELPANPASNLTGEEYLKTLPPDMQPLIKKIANYEMDPKNSSINGGHRERILSAVAQFDPTYDAATFPAKSKAVRDFATGAQGNAVRSFDVAVDHLGTLRELATALENRDMRAFNMIRNKFKDQFGYDAPSNFDAAKSIVSAEITKAIVGGNSALADREELRAPLSNSKSFGQLAGVIDKVYTPLMAGQLKGLKKQYEDTTGRKDFDTRLREGTKSALMGHSVAGGSSASPLPPGFELVKP